MDETKREWFLRDLCLVLIEDFKKKGMLETEKTPQEREMLNAMLGTANNITEAVSGIAVQLGFNNVSAEELDRMPTIGWKFAFLALTITHYGVQVENFKNLMLYLLKRNQKINHRTTLGKLMNYITEVSPTGGSELEKLLSVEFRNAFAHSRFWITEHEIAYIPRDDFSKYNVIKHADFISHARSQNMLTKSLGDIINDYYLPKVG